MSQYWLLHYYISISLSCYIMLYHVIYTYISCYIMLYHVSPVIISYFLPVKHHRILAKKWFPVPAGSPHGMPQPWSSSPRPGPHLESCNVPRGASAGDTVRSMESPEILAKFCRKMDTSIMISGYDGVGTELLWNDLRHIVWYT